MPERLSYAKLSDLPTWIAALIYRRWYEQSIAVTGSLAEWIEAESTRNVNDDPRYDEVGNAEEVRYQFALLSDKQHGRERKA